jgi:poly(A) polymerase
VRRYRTDAGELLGRLNELTRCDCTTRNEARARAISRRIDELEVRLEELSQREAIDAIRPQLDGDEVMTVLGIGPGRDVGAALAFLLEVRMEDGLLAEDDIRSRLAQWWAARQAD